VHKKSLSLCPDDLKVFECGEKPLGDCCNPCVWEEKWSSLHDKWFESLLHSTPAIYTAGCASHFMWVTAHTPHHICAWGHHISPWTSSIFHLVPWSTLACSHHGTKGCLHWSFTIWICWPWQHSHE
jgi:hypothetical protein